MRDSTTVDVILCWFIPIIIIIVYLCETSDHLKIHMKTHDNQKPFQCTVCNRGYSTAAALTSHMQNHHKRAAERANSPQISGPSYKCLQCTQIFRKPDELQVGTQWNVFISTPASDVYPVTSSLTITTVRHPIDPLRGW